MTSATTAAAAATTSKVQTAAEKDTKGLVQNYNQFLTLLTTQLKNQDPLSPMDSTQFTNQLVAFSGVEQQIKMNDNLTKLLANSSTSQTTLGLSYIGRRIDMPGTTFKLVDTANVKMSYSVPKTTKETNISIINSQGVEVFSKKGEQAVGKYDLAWDGKDKAGQDVPAGKYTLRITAVDNDDKSVNVTSVVPGIVEGIETADDGSILLSVNDQKIRMDSVKKASL